MDIKTKNLPQSQIELTINLSSEEMAGYIDAAGRVLSLQNPVNGFRPGFVPPNVAAREFGQQKVNETAADLAIKERLGQAVLENNLEVVGEPKISNLLPQNNGLEFKAVVSVIPRVEPGDYKNIRVPLEEAAVGADEIERALEDIRRSRAQNTAAPRPAQKGDRVEIDFIVKQDGKPVENGASQQHPLILGEGHFIEGFENALVGLKEGEERKFSLTAPADYRDQALAGRELDFEVKMNLVQERKLPDLTDEFARSLGRFGSLDELKTNVAEGLKTEKEIKAKEKQRAKVVDILVGQIGKVELPEELVETELARMAKELSDSLAQMNLTPENYLRHINKNPDDLKKDWRPLAEKRVKAALVLKEIAQRENIRVSEAEIEDRLGQVLRSAPPMAHGQNLDLTALRGYVKGIIRNEKVFEILEQ